MPTIKILTCKSCSVSARLLANKVRALSNLRVLVTRNAAKIRRRGRFIRYGNADATRGLDTAFNSAAFIRLVADKKAFASVMEQHGVHSPVYRNQGKPEVYPAMIRKTLTASNAKGIVVCPDVATFDANWKPCYHWTPFVKTRFELRAHVLGGKIVKLFKKIKKGAQVPDAPDGDDDEGAQPEGPTPIRNLDNGYHYQARDLAKYPQVQTLVDQIHPILGGKMYTLDIGWDRAAKRYFVFEANSGSGLNTDTVERYAQYLVGELNQVL